MSLQGEVRRWAKVPLGKIARAESGFGFPRSEQGLEGEEFPFFKVSDMNLTGNEVEMCRSNHTISAEVITRLGARVFPAGTVIFPKIGAAIATEKKRLLAVPATYDNNVMGIVPGPEICAKFVYYWFQTLKLGEISNKGPVPSIRKSDIEKLLCPLPPPSEQRRIVEILDQADHLRRLRAEADAKAARILPALLARVLGSPTNWPGDPRSRKLEDLVHLVSGATPSKANREYWDGRVPWVSPKDMKRDFLTGSQDHLSQAALDETNLKTIEPGNVLIVVRGMILAREVPVALNLVPVTINQDMKALVPKTDELAGSFLWAALGLARTSLQALVRIAAHGTRKLDTPELMQFPVVVPSAKQLAQVDAAVCKHRQLLAGRENVRAKIDRVFSVLLSRAFDGSLTANWREARMKELLQEMAEQAKAVAESTP